MSNEQVQQHAADIGAGVATVATGFYFIEVLEATALIIAILSGTAALAWHIYRAYREYQFRKGGNYASPTSIQSGTSTQRDSTAEVVEGDK
jgi:hypothetical protein